MEGKVKCSGCGHSWDKSDSSKKDMYVCHQCGKDNVMKNGGWLNKYDDGGFVQPNANDSKVSMSEDFVGLGYNTKGRNYSPAWGGQFQDGGFIPSSPQEQISSALQPTSSDQQASPYLQKKDPVEFYKSFINSPEYARRQLLTGYSASPKDEEYGVPNAAASRKTRLASLENIDPITYDTRQPSDAKPGLYGGPSYININPSDYAGTSREAIEAHELGHLAGATTPGQFNRPGSMSAMEQDIFRKSMLPMKEPVLSGVQGSKEREASLRNLEDFQHLQKPEESKADLNALRFMMYDKGIYDITKGKKFTETDFEKAKQNLGKDRVFKRLENRMGKKNFVNLMNTIASTNTQEEEAPIAMNGASMPGSVGFTYARTAGSAPSEGKYAKKTMASAQKGKDIKKDATNVAASNKIAQLQLLGSPEYRYFKYLQSQPQLRQSPGMGEQIMRSADVVTDLMQLGNFIPNPVAQGIGRAGNIIGGGIDLVQAGMSAAEGDYIDAAINAASVGLAGGIGANTFRRNSKYLQPGQTLYPLSPQSFGSLNRTNYIEPFQKVKGMTDKSLLANRALLGLVGAETVYDAVPQKEYGGDIPSAQNGQEMRFYQNGLDFKPKGMQDGGEASLMSKANKFVSEGISGPITTGALALLNMIKPISNTEIYKTVRPVDYPNALQLPMHAYNYVMGNETKPLKSKDGKPHLAEEFWATAMGAPIEKQYLKESKYKPSKSKDPDAKYYTIRDIIDERDLMNLTKDLKSGEKMEMNGLTSILDSKWYSKNANTNKDIKFEDIDPLQRFTLQKSDDGSYVSIYDKYDFNNSALNKMMNPIEIYDRFYLPKKKNGGIVKDDNGYLNPDNFGKVVEIDSNDITMEGVNQPLLGISDTGDAKLMKPGKNYKFKGKKVTEFPVAKDGGWLDSYRSGGSVGINQLDAQPMKKLNQLLNFTNNPDKDNWLNKYN